LLVLFKVKAFPFKKKDKSHIFQPKSTFTLCSAAPCLFCFEAIRDRYLRTALNWLVDFIITLFFHQSDQFVTDFCTVITENCTVITKNCTVITKNCTAVWDALKSTNHSRVIFLCILLSLKTFASLKKIYFNAFSTWKVDSRNTAELFFLCVFTSFYTILENIGNLSTSLLVGL
jgi:hypothetical protein